METEAYLYRARVLAIEIPSDAPDFGTRVHIRRPALDKVPSFESKVEDGIFLSWNPEVIQGGNVLVLRNNKPKLWFVQSFTI